MSSEPFTTLEIVLSRLIDDDGRMAVKVATTPSTSSEVEILGLLEAAKMHVFQRWMERFQ